MFQKIFFILTLIFTNYILINRIITINNYEEKISNYYIEYKKNDNDFIGILSVPRLHIKNGFLHKENPRNNIKYNIQLLKESTMPDEENSNIIFAAHRGNSNVSYFNRLHKLRKGDKIIVEYQNEIYTYKYSFCYDVKKDGRVEINRDLKKKTITLITCKKGTNLQTVFIGYMI